eukprot:CAMPEP_0185354884 /NCGR_PEP_ID=MMETSP1364-20130426/5589_1 /TAXON_ID=38817 /ORGANISM="Gephyrocapsa oceanica, Strain RCC1303" /LENGTH=252 /DNA_ID=CAMNT_0027954631 /DNA_START=155 /DNA_END=910 /DNA_ORIENTATION=-
MQIPWRGHSSPVESRCRPGRVGLLGVRGGNLGPSHHPGLALAAKVLHEEGGDHALEVGEGADAVAALGASKSHRRAVPQDTHVPAVVGRRRVAAARPVAERRVATRPQLQREARAERGPAAKRGLVVTAHCEQQRRHGPIVAGVQVEHLVRPLQSLDDEAYMRPIASRSASRLVSAGCGVNSAPPSNTVCMFRAAAVSSEAATCATCSGTGLRQATRQEYLLLQAVKLHEGVHYVTLWASSVDHARPSRKAV